MHVGECGGVQKADKAVAISVKVTRHYYHQELLCRMSVMASRNPGACAMRA